MIGGYLYHRLDRDIDARLQEKVAPFTKFDVWDRGFIFHTNPYRTDQRLIAVSPHTVILSEDLLVGTDGDAGYRRLDLEADLLKNFEKNGAAAFDAVQSDFRMAAVSETTDGCSLFLVSNRAGSGRIYYHRLDTGIIFASDLRFLLEIIPLDTSLLAIYSLLKYGSILEPLTISRNVSAVPAAHYARFDVKTGRESTHPFFKYTFPCETDALDVSLDGTQEALTKSAAFLGNYPTAMLLSGGIDSSLYGCYLGQVRHEALQGFYCAFGASDPEYPFAKAVARKIGVDLKVATMEKQDALRALDDVVRLTDHPFSDFSSLPIVFLLRFIREHLSGQGIIIECNGGDDCFGFPDLQNETKFRFKHLFPGPLKKAVAACLKNSPYWKWMAYEGIVARIAALADVHERTVLNYFLAQAPVNYLDMQRPREWDETLQDILEQTSSACGENYAHLGYEAKITIRQLFFVNSARWAAKALSVGENLGLRVIYPYIWRDVLQEQGKLQWSAKVRNGIVKWPLKKLLEEFMPAEFVYRQKSGFVPPLVRWLTDPEFNQKARHLLIRPNGFVSQVIPVRKLDELLTDALNGNRLRFPILNMLWGAIFAEAWIQEHIHTAGKEMKPTR